MESDKSGGWDGCIHTTIYKINSKDLLYGTGGYVHYRAITYDGKGSEKECIYIYIFSPEHSTEAQMPYICVYTHTHTHTHTHIPAKLLQLCPILCHPLHYNLPSSSVHGIFQARILEWVAISLSRGSSPPRDRTWTIWSHKRLSDSAQHSDIKGNRTSSLYTRNEHCIVNQLHLNKK